MTLRIERLACPHFNERAPDVALQYIVLHYTGTPSAQAWIEAVLDPATQLSAHYLIDEHGQIFGVVDESKRAWHAGKSFWRGVTDMNSASIGIELANPGHEHGYLPFADRQLGALKNLLRAIVDRRRLDPTLALLAHADIAPTRKIDPGEKFPWRDLATDGFGLWPQALTRLSSSQPQKPQPQKPQPQESQPQEKQEQMAGGAEGPQGQDAAALLRHIGYACPDEAWQAPLSAFQRRFCPSDLGLGLTPYTMAALRAVAASIPVPQAL